jgi:hypothetical protein
VDLQKQLLEETLIWENSNGRVDDHVDITVYDMTTTAGVEQHVTLDYYVSANDSRKSIRFPWLHLICVLGKSDPRTS